MRTRLQTILHHPATRYLLILFGLWALFFWRYFTPDPLNRVTFPSGDFTYQFFIFRDLAYRQLVAGQLPLWVDCFFGGYPFHADPQSQLFYPPVWLSFGLLKLMGYGHFPLMALTIEATGHYLLISIFGWLFLRAETGHDGAALVGTVVLAYGGYLTGYPPLQTGILETVTWLPLILLVLRRLAAVGDVRTLALAALLLAVAFFAGHPQSFLFTLYLGAAYFAFRARGAGRGWRWIGVRLVGMFALLGMLSLVQLLPQAQYVPNSIRARLSFDQLAGGFPLDHLAQMVVTQLVVGFQPLYVGILALVLLVLAVMPPARKPASVFWLVVALIALLLSFGRNAIGYDLAYLLLPGFSLFRGQERAALLFAIAASVLVAHGAAWLLSQTVEHPLLGGARRWLRNLIPLALALLIGSIFAGQSAPDAWGHLPPRFGMLLFGLVASVLALSITGRYRQPLLLAIVVIELFSANARTNAVPVFEAYPYTPLLDRVQVDAATGRWFRVQDDFRMQGHWACGYGLSEWQGFSPIRLANWHAFDADVPELVRWSLMGIEYVITWRQDLVTREGVYLPAEVVHEGEAPAGESKVYFLNGDPQIAWLVGETMLVADNEAAYAAQREPGFDPRQTAVLTAPLPFEIGSGGTVTVTGMRLGEITLDVSLPEPGLLVVSQAYYPGWQASVSGSEVVLVDGFVVGVALPAGDYPLTIAYRPPLLLWSGIASLVGLLLVIGLLVVNPGWRQIDNLSSG